MHRRMAGLEVRDMETFIKLVTAWSPVLVALVTIIPTIIANRKKTEQSIKDMQESQKKEMEKTQESIKASQDAARRDMERMQATLDNHIREDEDEKARNQRYRILRFYDEMCEHKKHSESHFEDILDDIDDYEQYCVGHPDFRNNRGKVAMLYIKGAYGKIKSSGGFLTHDKENDALAG